MTDIPELPVALAAVRHGGEFLRGEYQRFGAIPDAPASITTEADRQVQELLLAQLRVTYPDDAYCAEEATATLAGLKHSGPRVWIIDPIDGTRGFARKNGEFSIMVALVVEGRIVLGIVHEPALGRLTYAQHGGGCWRQDTGETTPQRCRVSNTTALASATLTQSHSKNAATPSLAVQRLAPAQVVETYSAGIKLARVARGEADVYINDYEGFHDWDIAAGHILVEEAGGRVTGLHGQTLRYGLPGAWQRDGLLATNGPLHEAAVQRWRGQH